MFFKSNFVIFRLCLRNHECKKLCKEKCGDCEILVEKLLPNCQHKALVPCHVSEYQYLCTELVEDVVLISCDHVVKRKCHQKLEDVECTKPCRKWLNCGHMCTRLCHEEDDPDHIKVSFNTFYEYLQFFSRYIWWYNRPLIFS